MQGCYHRWGWLVWHRQDAGDQARCPVRGPNPSGVPRWGTLVWCGSTTCCGVCAVSLTSPGTASPRTRSATCCSARLPEARRGEREGTYLVLGRSRAGRRLLVVISPRPRNSWYVVTARDVDRAERRRMKR